MNKYSKIYHGLAATDVKRTRIVRRVAHVCMKWTIEADDNFLYRLVAYSHKHTHDIYHTE